MLNKITNTLNIFNVLSNNENITTCYLRLTTASLS
nr:MAG TPA: hypothetical protein [Caudoviricetes sp.]